MILIVSLVGSVCSFLAYKSTKMQLFRVMGILLGLCLLVSAGYMVLVFLLLESMH